MRITRRAALVSLAAASWQVSARARPASAAGPGRLLLLDASLTRGDLGSHVAAFGDAVPRRIDADLVRQWRGGLADELRSHAGPVTALVRWDKAFVLLGLARESRLTARSARLSHCLFKIEFDA